MSQRNSSKWSQKFLHAFRGLRIGSRGQDSFLVHIPVACFVLAAAAQLHVNTISWCILVLCIVTVLSAELFNTAIELLAKAITDEFNPHIRDALDIASAAVLVIALGAAVVGALILGTHFGVEMGWWTLTIID
ncbi:MAG: diacylglycerol kinase family protein [Planctomycetales bacterium]|nr:diacylglycerol kinase family protein [Planctomycetales bacterium]